MNYTIEGRFPSHLSLFLASASPRRRELLSAMGLSFTVCPCDVDETVRTGTHPADAVLLLSARKAQAASCTEDGAVIIASDTLVEIDGEPLGKPKDKADALSMLMRLSGREHRVHTGVSILFGGECRTARDTTRVFMRPFTEEEARCYIATGEPADKAGAYAIQGLGGALVDRIEGNYDTVVGLPCALVDRMLSAILGLSDR